MNQVLLMLGVFAATTAVSYVLISKVPQRLHTPLMAFTNAISAVTILGAMLLFATRITLAEGVLGGLAIALAAFNLIGGFAVTDRMTGLFKQQ